MKTDGIIFDLDGTLWNSIEGVCKSWNIVLREYNLKEVTYEDIKNCMGLPMNDIAKKLFGNISEEEMKKVMERCCEVENIYLEKNGGILFPKLEETLKELYKKYKLFIVSNCQTGYINCFLKAHNLEKYFTDTEEWGATGLPKGENNKLVIQRNNLKNAVYVGDTQGDRESARIAEIPFVYAAYGFGKVKDYDYKIDSFEELLNLF